MGPVKSDDGNVLRNAKPLLVQGFDDTDCREIVHGNHGGWPGHCLSDRVSRRQTSLETLVARHDRTRLEPEGTHTLDISDLTSPDVAEGRAACYEGDSAMSEMIQMLDGLPDPGEVIHLYRADVPLRHARIENGDCNLA